jgi:hypothetical protein
MYSQYNNMLKSIKFKKKKVRITVIISDKIVFKTRNVAREEHFIIITESVH